MVLRGELVLQRACGWEAYFVSCSVARVPLDFFLSFFLSSSYSTCLFFSSNDSCLLCLLWSEIQKRDTCHIIELLLTHPALLLTSFKLTPYIHKDEQ